MAQYPADDRGKQASTGKSHDGDELRGEQIRTCSEDSQDLGWRNQAYAQAREDTWHGQVGDGNAMRWEQIRKLL